MLLLRVPPPSRGEFFNSLVRLWHRAPWPLAPNSGRLTFDFPASGRKAKLSWDRELEDRAAESVQQCQAVGRAGELHKSGLSQAGLLGR